MIRYYRMDGSPYPPGDEGLMEWAKDFEESDRIVKQELLWNGIWISTVWLGLDHQYGDGPPLIFETMAFRHIFEETVEPIEFDGIKLPYRSHHPDVGIQERYSTLADAEFGHAWWKHELSTWRWTVHLWRKLLTDQLHERRFY